MAKGPKFLLGRGEKLTKIVPFHQGFGQSPPPYEWGEHREFLSEELVRQQKYFDDLADDACPNDQVVSLVTLHPQYYSRSAFPQSLLDKADLRLIGSKPVTIKPDQGRGSKSEGGTITTAMFVAGRRKAFRSIARHLPSLRADNPLAQDLLKVEKIKPLTSKRRIAGHLSDDEMSSLEIVLHFDAHLDFDWEQSFRAFAQRSGVRFESSLEYQTRGLWFLAAQGNDTAARRLAEFSFVRAIRPMPTMRVIEAPFTLRSARSSMGVPLPREDALDPHIKVAVFDGGLPNNHAFGRWVKAIEPARQDRIGNAVPELQAHGQAVTSALLFGSVGSATLDRPFCKIDHYRALGDQTKDKQLYSTLLYIDKILSSSSYEFVNFSIGPAEVIGDDTVTAWTAMLDDHFQQGQILAGIAVGNDGEEAAPHNRVQVPSDCVNAIAVGATDSFGPSWGRAPYSSIGPGRAPGTVRPEVVSFGGSDGNEFRFCVADNHLAMACGTSFATPTVMRTCTGLRAHFGREISLLAIRALLVHTADAAGHPRPEVGWGMPPENLADLTVCPDGSVRVLYQGVIDPTRVVRAEIPIPRQHIAGRINIKATFCYVCQTDPNTPGDYTRAGLDVCFRPDRARMPKMVDGRRPDPQFPAPKSFFEGVGRRSEQALRNDAFKWDTVRHAERRLNASSLNSPVFDIHYVARQPGRRDSPSSARRLPYALVITITADKHPSIYEDVVAEYAQILEPIRPRTQLPARVRK